MNMAAERLTLSPGQNFSRTRYDVIIVKEEQSWKKCSMFLGS
jgi:hypothetical protein